MSSFLLIAITERKGKERGKKWERGVKGERRGMEGKRKGKERGKGSEVGKKGNGGGKEGERKRKGE